ncbi:MAG: hypothetical protein MUF53_04565 [Gemmatimonadaceae bacterium]|jgi:hypothetical protein|nr:hypothetical protein [Gemmatimonadaceae bacterium]
MSPLSSAARTGLVIVLVLGAGVAALGARAFDLARTTTAARRAAGSARASADSLAAHILATREQALVARLRAQARAMPGLLLAVALDSGEATLFRDGLPLRRMPVEQFAGPSPEGAPAVERGEYAVGRVAGARDSVEVPAWAWSARAQPVPEVRRLRGGFGPVLVELVNGPSLYAVHTEGPLADSAFVLPGALRFRAKDLQAIKPNLAVGTPIYIY